MLIWHIHISATNDTTRSSHVMMFFKSMTLRKAAGYIYPNYEGSTASFNALLHVNFMITSVLLLVSLLKPSADLKLLHVHTDLHGGNKSGR